VGALLAQTIPLALAAAISPVLFLLQLTTLTGPRPVARGTALALGSALPLALVSAAAVFAGSSSALPKDSTIKAALDLGLGAVLLALGLRSVLRMPAAPKPKPARDPSLRRAFLLGVAGMATNVSTFALYIPALKLIAASHVGDVGKGLAGLVVFVVTLAFVLVPLALTVLAPGSERVLGAIGGWMSAHRRAIQVVLTLGFGIWLAAKGALAL
jgi:hypothetical protein